MVSTNNSLKKKKKKKTIIKHMATCCADVDLLLLLTILEFATFIRIHFMRCDMSAMRGTIAST